MNKIEIKKINGDLVFSHEQKDNTIKKTLEKANLRDAYLRGAYLRGAYLRGAYLRGANLSGVNLSDANLSDANLSGANLSDANLSDANLSDANLSDANLSDANLSDANLSDANLSGANLSDANLSDANLSDANLSDANLSGAKNIPQSYINSCSRDMLYIFYILKAELPQLREKLVKGKVNGSQYEGDCACLIGSLANIKNTKPKDFCKSLLPYYDMGLHNPGEQWFYQIHIGDTPKNNFFTKHAVKLIDEVLNSK